MSESIVVQPAQPWLIVASGSGNNIAAGVYVDSPTLTPGKGYILVLKVHNDGAGVSSLLTRFNGVNDAGAYSDQAHLISTGAVSFRANQNYGYPGAVGAGGTSTMAISFCAEDVAMMVTARILIASDNDATPEVMDWFAFDTAATVTKIGFTLIGQQYDYSYALLEAMI